MFAHPVTSTKLHGSQVFYRAGLTPRNNPAKELARKDFWSSIRCYWNPTLWPATPGIEPVGALGGHVSDKCAHRLASAYPRLREVDDQVDKRRAKEFRAFCYRACDRFVRMGKAI